MGKGVVLGGVITALFVAGAIFAVSSGASPASAGSLAAGSAKIEGCGCQKDGGNCGCTDKESCGCKGSCNGQTGAAAGAKSGCGCKK